MAPPSESFLVAGQGLAQWHPGRVRRRIVDAAGTPTFSDVVCFWLASAAFAGGEVAPSESLLSASHAARRRRLALVPPAVGCSGAAAAPGTAPRPLIRVGTVGCRESARVSTRTAGPDGSRSARWRASAGCILALQVQPAVVRRISSSSKS